MVPLHEISSHNKVTYGATTWDKFTQLKSLMVPHDISSHKKMAHDAATTWDKFTQKKWLMVPLHEINSHNYSGLWCHIMR